MDRPIVIKFDKLNCGSKCCGNFLVPQSDTDTVDGGKREKSSTLKRVLCCCNTSKKQREEPFEIKDI